MILERLERALSTLEMALDTKMKRHIVGGILMSTSLLFGGIAFTVMTLKMEGNKNER